MYSLTAAGRKEGPAMPLHHTLSLISQSFFMTLVNSGKGGVFSPQKICLCVYRVIYIYIYINTRVCIICR